MKNSIKKYKVLTTLLLFYLLTPLLLHSQNSIEFKVLESIKQEIEVTFPGILLEITVEQTEDDSTVYSLVVPMMAGANNIYRIHVYPSNEQALLAFDSEDSTTFQDYPAKTGSESTMVSDHFQKKESLEWIIQNRVFYVETQYNSTIPGDPVDPTKNGEQLMTAAQENHLFEQQSSVKLWKSYL